MDGELEGYYNSIDFEVLNKPIPPLIENPLANKKEENINTNVNKIKTKS